MFRQHQVTKDGKGGKKKRIEILFFVIIYDRGRLIERTMVSRFVTLLNFCLRDCFNRWVSHRRQRQLECSLQKVNLWSLDILFCWKDQLRCELNLYL